MREIGVSTVLQPNDLQFELSTGDLHAGQAYIEQIEAGDAPRNLIQLADLGRLTVYSADADTVALSSMLAGAHDGYIAEASYDLLDAGDWTREDYIGYGHWLDGLTRDPEQIRSSLSRYVLDRARGLGIGPALSTINRGRYFSSLSAYYEALSIVPGQELHKYDGWTDLELADYGEGVLLELFSQNNGQGGRPKLYEEIERRARLGEGPGRRAFYRDGKTMRDIMLLKGYYIDARCMGPEDYVELGVKIRQANEGRQLTMGAIDFLARTMRSPVSRSFRNKFRWDDYLNRVQAAYEGPDPSDFREKLPAIKQEIKDGVLPFSVIEDAATPQEALTRRAKWLLVNELMPDLDDQQRQVIVKHIRTSFEGVVRVRGRVSDDDIEAAATRLKIVEDLWPSRKGPQAYMDYLRVPEELMEPVAS